MRVLLPPLETCLKGLGGLEGLLLGECIYMLRGVGHQQSRIQIASRPPSGPGKGERLKEKSSMLVQNCASASAGGTFS